MTRAPDPRRSPASRWRLLAGAALLGAAGLGTFQMAPRHARAAADPSDQTAAVTPTADVIAKGKYLTDMGDCAGCHVAPGGAYMAGGQYMEMPFGVLSTPNITPDHDTGIGYYTDDNFIRLMRHGVRPNGQYIYPAMPYVWYNSLSRSDLLAIKAYLFTLKPVHAPRQPNKVWFPFNIRPAIALWDAVFVPNQEFKPDPKQSDLVNRGDWIVNGLEHCGECHNNRNFLGNGSVALRLQGGPITLWYAPNIHPDNLSGIGSYSTEDMVQYFKKGHSEQMGTVAGPMSETVKWSTSKLTDDDLHAIVAYLKSRPATASYQARTAAYRPVRAAAGEAVYLNHCASCHQVDGHGIKDKVPALDGNGMVRAYGAQDVVQIVLGGLEAHGQYAVMPGVGSEMSDKEISDVSNYVRQAWTNKAPANATPLLVSVLRKDTATLLNGKRPNGCPASDEAPPGVTQMVADQSNGIGALLSATHATNMLQNVNAIVAKIKTAAPGLEQADIVNGLTIAYCPIVESDDTVSPDQKPWQLTHFAQRLYVQLTTDGNY